MKWTWRISTQTWVTGERTWFTCKRLMHAHVSILQRNWSILSKPSANQSKVIWRNRCRCTWERSPCSAANFTQHLTDYGLCYTFNALPHPDQLNTSQIGNYYVIVSYEYTCKSPVTCKPWQLYADVVWMQGRGLEWVYCWMLSNMNTWADLRTMLELRFVSSRCQNILLYLLEKLETVKHLFWWLKNVYRLNFWNFQSLSYNSIFL